MIGQKQGIGESMAGLGREGLEALLELLPSPQLLAEPGSGRVTFANRAAHRVVGGEFPIGMEMPGTPAAGGGRVEGFEMEWRTPAGVRSLILTADTFPAVRGLPETVVISFEDVSALNRAEGRVQHQAALLDTLFDTAPVGIAFLDRELRYVRINAALAAVNGLPPEDHVGRTIGEVVPQLPAEIVEDFRRVALTGEPLVNQEAVLELPTAPGEYRHFMGSYYPVRAGGEVVGVGVVVQDVTERALLLEAEQRARERAEAAEHRWAFLADASALLGSSLHFEETLRRLAEIAVPDLADWCAVDMLQADGAIQRLAVHHADPEKQELGWDLARRWPPRLEDPIGVGTAIRSGEVGYYPELPDELLQTVARDEEQLALLRRVGLSSAIVVPLQLRGRQLGALTLVAETGRRFEQEDVELAGELARRAAVAIENARLYRDRSRIARTLQRSLLPPHLPDIPGFEVAARYRAAGEGFEVGGDFYDLFETSKGTWTVVMGDVCGKGADAAALTALARHTLRAAAIQENSPSAVLSMLNDAVLREVTDGRFVTAALAMLYQSAGAAPAVLACGGHPLPLVARADGEVELVGAHGMVLGIQAAPPLTDRTLVLGPGDALVLYTDGVADHGSPAGVLGLDELREILAAASGADAETIADAIERPLLALENGDGGRDDAAILVIRRRP